MDNSKPEFVMRVERIVRSCADLPAAVENDYAVSVHKRRIAVIYCINGNYVIEGLFNRFNPFGNAKYPRLTAAVQKVENYYTGFLTTICNFEFVFRTEIVE
ncbi:MAG: hypothetical protein LBP59_10800 [Planctomycetaceae bacterium]|jgi:hypothetical protein|nr:hypothetical protein [Planctomycetaceae bacterium]